MINIKIIFVVGLGVGLFYIFVLLVLVCSFLLTVFIDVITELFFCIVVVREGVCGRVKEGGGVSPRRHHPLYRRAAHGGGRGQGRRRHGRRQPAEAHGGARRAALHRRHHAR